MTAQEIQTRLHELRIELHALYQRMQANEDARDKLAGDVAKLAREIHELQGG